MIPVRLELHDFLSYADPEPIDFTVFDVACLSGDNGVGKSALLDAMTWALFGAARGCENGQNQDRLIRDGCGEAVVDFTFELAGDRYRIVRRRSRNERGETKGDVRLLVADGDGAAHDSWKNIADETLTATDAKIESLLRMDYRTFTASAFFLQGHSEDFLARMNPSERRDVFARLLDLGVYEELEDAAKRRASEAERARLDVAARIGELEGASVDLAALDAELRDVGERMTALDEQVGTQSAELDAKRDALARIETQEALLDRERRALRSDVDARQAAEVRAEALREELARIDGLLARADEVAAAIRELEELRVGDAAARREQAAAAELKQRAAEIVATIESDRRAITGRLNDTRGRVALLETERASLREAQAAIARIDAELESTVDPAPAVDAARRQLETHQVAAGRFEGELRSLDERLATASDALGVLGAGGGECPVCGSALDAAHRAEAKRRLLAETKELTASKQGARAALTTERKESKRLAEEIRRLETVARDREALAASREGLCGRLERLAAVEAEIGRLQAAADVDSAALDDDAFAAARTSELADLQTAWTALYDAAAHEAVLRRMDELEPFIVLRGALDEAGVRRPKAAADLDAAHDEAGRLDSSIAARTEAIVELERLTGARGAAVEALRGAQSTLEQLRAVSDELTAAQARLEERRMAALAVEAELQTKRSDERRLAVEHRRYRRLAEAFGRRGIPDRVIDNALPELTEDANRVLGRLSDHEMSVHFELQGRTRSGKEKETFNVLVSHEGGLRDYAMFSGGEAFRVAFAVRLAMSKLLVHRAGARLETLVIDEGFGTQDPHGRERLVEAINLARQEFAKIIVITHLDDMKDQFGAQICVTKGPEGSELRTSGG